MSNFLLIVIWVAIVILGGFTVSEIFNLQKTKARTKLIKENLKQRLPEIFKLGVEETLSEKDVTMAHLKTLTKRMKLVIPKSVRSKKALVKLIVENVDFERATDVFLQPNTSMDDVNKSFFAPVRSCSSDSGKKKKVK